MYSPCIGYPFGSVSAISFLWLIQPDYAHIVRKIAPDSVSIPRRQTRRCLTRSLGNARELDNVVHRAWSRPSIHATPRSSGSPSSATARRSGPACVRSERAPGPAPTARTSSTSTTARRPRATPSCSPWAASSPSRAWGWSSTDRGHAGRTPTSATAGSSSPTACGWRATGGTGAAHPPGPLPGRAGRADGPGRGDRPRLPRAAAGDVHGPGVGVGGRDPRPGPGRRARRVRVRRGLHEEREGLLGRGRHRPRHDRRRSGDPRAGRRGDGLPGRVRRHPRVRGRDPRQDQGRPPRGDDPRVPEHVADLQRAVRGGAGQARQRR